MNGVVAQMGERPVCTREMRIRFSPTPPPWSSQRKGHRKNDRNRNLAKRCERTCYVCELAGDVRESAARGGVSPRVADAPGLVSKGRGREASFPNGHFTFAVRVRFPPRAPWLLHCTTATNH